MQILSEKEQIQIKLNELNKLIDWNTFLEKQLYKKWWRKEYWGYAAIDLWFVDKEILWSRTQNMIDVITNLKDYYNLLFEKLEKLD